jgi:hypothetical protein
VSIDEFYLTVSVLLKYHFNSKFKIHSGTQILSASFVNDICGLKTWSGSVGLEHDLTKNLFLDVPFRHGFDVRTGLINFRDNRISVVIGYGL